MQSERLLLHVSKPTASSYEPGSRQTTKSFVIISMGGLAGSVAEISVFQTGISVVGLEIFAR